MDTSYLLSFELLHYWRCGTGKSSGSHVDATVDLDAYGCPFISGSMIKGLLRDAVYRTCLWNSAGWSADALPLPSRLVEILFGSSAVEEVGEEDAGISGSQMFARPLRQHTRSGALRVGDAVLEQDVRLWLRDHHVPRGELFRDVYSTAIAPGTRIAKHGSLRGAQVTIPVTLRATLEIMSPEDMEADPAIRKVIDNHEIILKTALPLVLAVGSGRTRGFGRARTRLEPVK